MRAVVAALALAAALLACGHDAKPVVEPDPHPPLPEGTPIGYLIDDASELQLRDDQVAQLKEIDSELVAKIDAIDAGQHRPAARSAGAGSQNPGRRRGGGRRGGGRRGGGAGSGSAAAASPGPTTAAADQRSEARAGDVRAAIASAFALLDPVQRAMASRVLSQHGVDLDAGRAAAEPAAAEPSEPDSDSDDK
jgi:hypothetical protein